MKAFHIKFWGVRGSIPTPGHSTIRYGGNTSCVEIRVKNGAHFILDAGTGIRELGNHLIRKNIPVSAYILISHFHWDHIQGLPFFRPAYNPENKFIILGSDDAALKLDKIISFQMDPTYFPITIEDMKAAIEFKSIREEEFSLQGVNIETLYLNHPGYALGYRLKYNNHCIVYISDNEPFYYENSSFKTGGTGTQGNKVEEVFDTFIENKEDKLIQFCQQADILIHDTQFLPEEYEEKKTWGHSPFNYTVNLALKSRVKQLVLFHHDPDHDDAMIDQILSHSRKLIKNAGKAMKCLAAREGLQIKL